MRKIVVVSAVCMLSIFSLFSGCTNVPRQGTQFSISSFTVEPSVIRTGGFANLSWAVPGASSVSIDNGIGSVSPIGYKSVAPARTTTYTLIASNATITKSATVTITVNATSNESNGTTRISIVSFEGNPSEIDLGGSAELYWAVTSATSVSIDNGIGSVALVGHCTVTPAVTTTYTLTASAAGAARQATVRIYVQNGEPGLPQNTPTISCSTDSTTDRVTVVSADLGIHWRDIVVTTDSQAASWQVYSIGGSRLDLSGHTSGITTDVTAGDYIALFGTTGKVVMTLRYIPTNTLMGTWTVNV